MPIYRQFRVALTGASSAGKTTLVQTLLKHPSIAACDVAAIPEGASEILAQMGRATFQGLKASDLVALQLRLFEWQMAAESAVPRFLADRSFVDIAAVWAERDAPHALGQGENLVNDCRRLAVYTLVVQLPSGALPYVNDGLREEDVALQQKIAERIAAYLTDWSIPHITLRSLDLEERVVEVVQELRARLILPPI